jgi:ABC-type branched-subunit amino acid transport system substrate-binding protein
MVASEALRVAVVMPASIDPDGEFLASVRALEAAGADMVALDGDGEDLWVALGAVAAATVRVRLWVTATPPEALTHLSRGRVVTAHAAGETWAHVDVPADRSSWAATLRDQAAAGVSGVFVPWDPRLIDLLRNPDPDDRSDLQMATG